MRFRARVFILIVFICGHIVTVWGNFKQQHAKVIRANLKYVKFVSIFTIRRGRNSPYVTDLNITTLAYWGNNVTIKTMFYKHKEKSQALTIELKACDLTKLKWARDWVEKYSNMSVTCPLKPGAYRFTGFEVPPKNFPLPMGRGDYENNFLIYLTKTKEIILELSMDLKFENKVKKT